MSAPTDNRKIFSLLEVTESIKQTLANRYGSSYWVKAEMNKLNYYPHSGHCYPELIEKRDGKIVAQIRGTLWKDDYLRVNEAFINTLSEPLKNGINILFLARVMFDPVYGLSLRISDIDPSFTLGELEREKRESIIKLRKEGIFDRNKHLLLPLLPKRIAVISVETSKGYADFLKITTENPWGYRFFMMLFPALLQGEKVGASIGYQLDRIEQVKHHFDLVAIIRGGGGDAGLAGYNDVSFARKVALFPLPVITGIGHATNETVVEMVAFRNCITPTEVADFLIQQYHNFAVPLRDAIRMLSEQSHQLIAAENRNNHQLLARFVQSTTAHLGFSRHRLINLVQNISGYTRFFIRNKKDQVGRQKDLVLKEVRTSLYSNRNDTDIAGQRIRSMVSATLANDGKELEQLQKHVSMLDPRNVLARGFSITLVDGKAIRSQSEVLPGNSIKTIIFDGEIQSTVTKTHTEQPL